MAERLFEVFAAPSGSAVGDRVYRYKLTRWWADGPRATFVMFNPSTAAAETDDPTIRRCIGFARAWGCGSLQVVNLFALRATRPAELLAHPDPVGPANPVWLAEALGHRDGTLIAAWGAHKIAVRPAMDAHGLAAAAWQCLGTTRTGAPRHPLYLPSSARLRPWDPYQPALLA